MTYQLDASSRVLCLEEGQSAESVITYDQGSNDPHVRVFISASLNGKDFEELDLFALVGTSDADHRGSFATPSLEPAPFDEAADDQELCSRPYAHVITWRR